MLPFFTCVLTLAGRCLSRIRVVPWITSRRLSINHPGTYGCALSAEYMSFFCYLALGNEVLRPKTGYLMAVSFIIFELFFTLEKLFGKLRRSCGLSPPPLWHPHCDTDVLPAIRLRLSLCAPSLHGHSLAQEGGIILAKKRFSAEQLFFISLS